MVHPVRYSISARLTVGFVMLLGCAASLGWFIYQKQGADRWVGYTYLVKNQLDVVQMAAMRVEIERRGYLINGRTDVKRQFLLERTRMVLALDRLAAFTEYHDGRYRRVLHLKSTSDVWFSSRKVSVEHRTAGRTGEAPPRERQRPGCSMLWHCCAPSRNNYYSSGSTARPQSEEWFEPSW